MPILIHENIRRFVLLFLLLRGPFFLWGQMPLTIIGDSAYSRSNQNPVIKPGWHLVFQDEFDGNSLDTSIWEPRLGTYNNGNSWVNGLQNIRVDNGSLKLFSLKDSVYAKGRWFPYTGGWISTNMPDFFGQGTLIESRCRRCSMGNKSSFWIYNPFTGDEIDFFDNEFYPEQELREVLVNIDSGNTRYSSYRYILGSRLADQDKDWFLYSNDYRENELLVYLNNQLMIRHDSFVPQEPGKLNLWCVPLDYRTGQIQEFVDQGFFPGIFEVDYTRVYKMNSEISEPMHDFGIEQGWASQEIHPRFMSDINGDGKADIIGFGPNGVKVSLSSSGFRSTGFTAPVDALNDFHPEQGWSDQNNTPRILADINGDGSSDIIGFGQIDSVSGVYVSLSVPGSVDPVFTLPELVLEDFSIQQGWENQEKMPRLMADVNGDGKSDIIGFDKGNVRISISLSGDSLPSFGNPQWVVTGFSPGQGYRSQLANPRMMADVNADGKADIVGFSMEGVEVSLSRSNGKTALFTKPIRVIDGLSRDQGWTSNDSRPRMLKDVNDDGKADIIAFGQDGTYLSLSQSKGMVVDFSEPGIVSGDFCQKSGYFSMNTSPRLVGDLNNDGKAEILGMGDNLGIAGSISGRDTFRFPETIDIFEYFSANSGWGGQDTHPRYLADITGDGSLSLVGFDRDGMVAYQDMGATYNIPFEISSSTTGKADNWNLSGEDGPDVAVRFFLHSLTIISLHMDNQLTDFNARVEIFSEEGKNVGFRMDRGEFSEKYFSATEKQITLSRGYYYLVVDGVAGETGRFSLRLSGN